MNPIKYAARFARENPLTSVAAGVSLFFYGLADAINSGISPAFNPYEIGATATLVAAMTYPVEKFENLLYNS